MFFFIVTLFCVCVYVPTMDLVELDVIDCGIDEDNKVSEGSVSSQKYPFYGVLYYTYYDELGETRAVTGVALIQREFAVAAAADIGAMPKYDFRRVARVLLGEGWEGRGRRVRNYVIHPEYEETENTVALIQLRDPVRDPNIKPFCPPPHHLKSPSFYIIKYDEHYEKLQKMVLPMEHVPAALCRDFYIQANLYEKRMRPPHAACALSLASPMPCVWEAGAALVSRDVWGRWMLLGIGVRGPGCGAPSRYLDMMSYYPWIENSLEQFQQLTISKISNQKYVLRSGGKKPEWGAVMQRFGNCDAEETKNLLFRESIVLKTDNSQYQFLTYNIFSRPEGLNDPEIRAPSINGLWWNKKMSLYNAVEYTCLTLEIVNGSATSELRVKHFCPRMPNGPVCHIYMHSVFEISIYLMFTDTCRFEMNAFGFEKNMTLLDVQLWKWEEGTYYEDFSMTHVEYHGPTHMTEFGFEPVNTDFWVPDYDVWTTTAKSRTTTRLTTTTELVHEDDENEFKQFVFIPTSSTPTTTRVMFKLKPGYEHRPRPYHQPLTTTEEPLLELDHDHPEASGGFFSNIFNWFG